VLHPLTADSCAHKQAQAHISGYPGAPAFRVYHSPPLLHGAGI